MVWGRRFGGAGVRRFVRGGPRANGLGASLRSLLGASLILEYDAAVYTLGSDPDVAAAPNIANPGFADISQSTEASRPHAATDASGFPCWTFDDADDWLGVTEASPILSAGDYPTVWVLQRFAGSGPDTYFSLNQDGAETTTGLWGPIRAGSPPDSSVSTRITTPSGNRTPVVNGFTGDTGLHLLRFRATSSAAEMYVPGKTPATVAGDSPLKDDVDDLRLGLSTWGAYYAGGNLLHVAVARNLTTQQVDAATNYILARFGL